MQSAETVFFCIYQGECLLVIEKKAIYNTKDIEKAEGWAYEEGTFGEKYNSDTDPADCYCAWSRLLDIQDTILRSDKLCGKRHLWNKRIFC